MHLSGHSAVLGMETPPCQGSTKLLTLVLYPVEPTPAPSLVRGMHHPKKRLSHRLDTGKSENAALQSAHPMRPEIPPIHHGRHPHRHNETGRPSGQEGTWEALFAVLEGNPWAHYLFNEPFEECGHHAVPQRENDEEMLCGNDCVTRRRQHFRNGPSLEVLLRTQQWEVEFRGLNASNLMPTENRAFGICIGESVAEPVPGGIGMTLNNREAPWHGRLTYRVTELTCINGNHARSEQDDIASLVRT